MEKRIKINAAKEEIFHIQNTAVSLKIRKESSMCETAGAPLANPLDEESGLTAQRKKA